MLVLYLYTKTKQKLYKFYVNSEDLHVYICLNDFCSIVSYLKDSKSISDQFPKHKWIKMTKNEVKKWSPRLRPDIYLLSAREKYLSSQKWEGRVSRV